MSRATAEGSDEKVQPLTYAPCVQSYTVHPARTLCSAWIMVALLTVLPWNCARTCGTSGSPHQSYSSSLKAHTRHHTVAEKNRSQFHPILTEFNISTQQEELQPCTEMRERQHQNKRDSVKVMELNYLPQTVQVQSGKVGGFFGGGGGGWGAEIGRQQDHS